MSRKTANNQRPPIPSDTARIHTPYEHNQYAALSGMKTRPSITVDGQELLTLSALHCIYRGWLRKGGWRMLPGGVNCSRPGRWGNPWAITDYRTATEAVAKYRQGLYRKWREGLIVDYLAPLLAKYRTQHGMIILYCWCRLDAPCHCHPLADALVKELEKK